MQFSLKLHLHLLLIEHLRLKGNIGGSLVLNNALQLVHVLHRLLQLLLQKITSAIGLSLQLVLEPIHLVLVLEVLACQDRLIDDILVACHAANALKHVIWRLQVMRNNLPTAVRVAQLALQQVLVIALL